MRYTIILILSILLIQCINKRGSKNISTQNSRLDSILIYANSDSLSPTIKRSFARRAVKLLANQKNDSNNRKYYFKVANRFYNNGDYQDYKNITNHIIELSQTSEDSVSLAKAYKYLGDYYDKCYKSDSTYYFYFKSENLYRKLGDNSKIASILLNKGIIQYNEGDYVGAEKTCLDALKHLRGINDDEAAYQTNNILAIIYKELDEFSKSLYYNQRALEIARRNKIYKEFHAESSTLNNIGYLYRDYNQYDKAIQYYEKALTDKDIYVDKISLYAMLIDNIAYSKYKNGDDKKSLSLFYKALRIRDSLNLSAGIIESSMNLSEYFHYKSNDRKAIEYAENAYEVAKKSRLPKDILKILKHLSKIDHRNAFRYSSEYFKINDSIQKSERQVRNKFARIEYETEELSLEKDRLVEQRKSLIYIVLGILTLGTFLFVIRFQAAKNRELLFVQEQQKANEEIYQLMLGQQNKVEEVRQIEKKRIAQELHDGVLGKLFGTRMNLGALNNLNDDKAVSERVVFIDELKNLEQEIREISHDLSSEKAAIFNNFVLMLNNFIAAQRSVCKAHIEIELPDTIDWNRIDNVAKINFYRILQEAFQNINKHSRAKNVSVRFFQEGGELRLTIHDDGVGFNYGRKKKGIGLLNMDARIKGSGGHMTVDTAEGKGTVLKFALPLATNQQT